VNLEFITILFILQTKKKSKYLICEKEVNLMNLVCVVAAFNLFSKSKMYVAAHTPSNQHIRGYTFKKMKLLLAFFYVIFFLLKQKRSIFYLTKLVNKHTITKKFFNKIFSENFFFNSEFLPTKKFFSYYYTFYKDFAGFKGSFQSIQYNFELLKTVCLKFYNLYSKFIFTYTQKFDIGRGLVSKYCRCILNFRDKSRILLLSAIKKCLLFLKNKYVYTFKYSIPTYIDELSLVYSGFLEGVLGNNNQNITGMDLFYSKNSFSNFLKSSDYLDSFYKEYYFNVHLKKIKHNFYVTITNRKGGVIFSNSSGKVGLLKKKQKKSMFAINLVVRPAIKSLLKSNILALKNFFCPISLQYVSLKVKYFFLRLGVAINNIVIFNNKSHNFSCRKLKKQRRM
jgi:ribosomal protein S11